MNTEDAKKLAKVTEFKVLVRGAELKHKKTPAALIEETLPDIPVATEFERSVVRNSIENLEHDIGKKAAKIEDKAKAVTMAMRKIMSHPLKRKRGPVGQISCDTCEKKAKLI